jgi:hypothetical protein
VPAFPARDAKPDISGDLPGRFHDHVLLGVADGTQQHVIMERDRDKLTGIA